MPWNNQGGGNNGGGPWGQGGGGGPWGQGGGGGQPPQDIDALIRQGRDAWRRMMPGGGAYGDIAFFGFCPDLGGHGLLSGKPATTRGCFTVWRVGAY